VTDGPFSETKEVIGGWAILKADSKAESDSDRHPVHGVAPKALARLRGESEVRPMFDPGMGP